MYHLTLLKSLSAQYNLSTPVNGSDLPPINSIQHAPVVLVDREPMEVVMRSSNRGPQSLREPIGVDAAGEGVAVLECATKSVPLPPGVPVRLDVDVRVGLLAGIGPVNVRVVCEAAGELGAVDGVDEVDTFATCGWGRWGWGWSATA